MLIKHKSDSIALIEDIPQLFQTSDCYARFRKVLVKWKKMNFPILLAFWAKWHANIAIFCINAAVKYIKII